MKIKKFFKSMFIVLITAVIAAALCAGIFILSYQPSLTLDFSEKTGEVKGGASGYLYGIAENGVPSTEITKSLGVTTAVQKVSGGLQHPISDIDNVYYQISDADYNLVYLQDIYEDWYYHRDAVMQMRKDGTYDCNSFIESDYLPKVEALTRKMSSMPYSDKLIYCLYNECDNGDWFGETKTTDDKNNAYGVYGEYNEKGMDNYNQAWKKTYDLVRSINPKALILGPNYCDFNPERIEYFFKFCKENNCLPDFTAYHELGEKSIYFWQEHIDSYREIEKKLGIKEIPIIITEYGKTDDNGYPGQMIKYISVIENSKVYADNAYWRLADNFNDNCADANSPNAQWWLMHWYSDMKGETVKGVYKDLWNSDFKNSVRDKKKLNYQGFMGIASLSNDGKEIDIICGGNDTDSKVILKNLNKTKLYGKTAEITIEETVYKGLYGVCSESVTIKKYAKKLDSKLKIELKNPDSANAYHIVIKQADESALPAYENEFAPKRYEFEEGKLYGKAYTYDSYCPASSLKKSSADMVGGLENEGDGVEVKVDVPKDGKYVFDIIYGKGNDGEYDESGYQSPDDRISALAELTIGKEKEKIALENTLKSEYTSCYTVEKELKKGEHKVKLMHISGTFVLDSLVVSAAKSEDENKSIAVMRDAKRDEKGIKAFIAVAPEDGYYSVTTSSSAKKIIVAQTPVNTNEISAATVYLKRGLNFVDVETGDDCELTVVPSDTENVIELKSDSALLSGGAVLKTGVENMTYIDGVSSVSGSAQFRFNAPSKCRYRVTLTYSNNEENGHHDYNTDLVERYVTVTCGGVTKNVYCRNTYSWQTLRTVTFEIDLSQGENVLTLSNNGANKFNNNTTYAPHIYMITVNPLQA